MGLLSSESLRLSGFLLFAGLLGAQPKPAVLLLPIEYDLSGFLLQAERDLPTQLHSEWVPLGQRIPMPVAYRYDLTRSPLELEGAGVGKATTSTVVQSVVAIVIADLMFTAIFFALKLT